MMTEIIFFLSTAQKSFITCCFIVFYRIQFVILIFIFIYIYNFLYIIIIGEPRLALFTLLSWSSYSFLCTISSNNCAESLRLECIKSYHVFAFNHVFGWIVLCSFYYYISLFNSIFLINFIYLLKLLILLFYKYK